MRVLAPVICNLRIINVHRHKPESQVLNCLSSADMVAMMP
jgi:hypothetical protein